MADLIDQAVAFVKSPAYIELTTRQLAVLGMAMNAVQPLKVKDMAAAISVKKPIVSRALDRMEREGLLERRKGKDKRDCFIHVTDAGRAFRSAIGGGQ